MNIPKGKKLILFDGVCVLCNKWVHRIIKYDRDEAFVFATLKSEMGKGICEKYDLDKNGSIVLVSDGNYWVKSKAVFEILKEINGPWKSLLVFQVLPGVINDLGYDLIAKNRYKIYGKNDHCLVPVKGLKGRFLDL